MQRCVERHKHGSVNVKHSSPIRPGLKHPFHLSIELVPHRGCNGIAQNRPRPRRQRIVRLKRATFISETADGVNRSLTVSFSPLLYIL